MDTPQEQLPKPPEETNKESAETAQDGTLSVRLKVIDWFGLLKQLEDEWRIINKDHSKSYRLWELLASELSNTNVNLIFNGVDVLDPDHKPWPKKPVEKPIEKNLEPDKDCYDCRYCKKWGWLFFGYWNRNEAKCKHPDLGKSTYCTRARRNDSLCGKSARWFSPKSDRK